MTLRVSSAYDFIYYLINDPADETVENPAEHSFGCSFDDLACHDGLQVAGFIHVRLQAVAVCCVHCL